MVVVHHPSLCIKLIYFCHICPCTVKRYEVVIDHMCSTMSVLTPSRWKSIDHASCIYFLESQNLTTLFAIIFSLAHRFRA